MERDEIVDNVVTAIDGVVEIVPKKWGNVRSLHVKLLESLALPVYQAAPDIKLKIDGVKGEDVNEEEEKGGEFRDRKMGKKGRIHQIRYMDDKVGDDDGDAVVDDDDDSSLIKQRKNKVYIEDDESSQKEEKKQKKRVDVKVKAMKSKKVA